MGTAPVGSANGSGLPIRCFKLRARTEAGWETIGVCFENPTFPIRYDNVGFLAYDGSLTLDPVNQVFYNNPFQEHASRFAHQLDDAMGHHSLSSASEEDRMVVINTLSAMIGSAWQKFAEWREVDPEELIVGGNFDGTPLWRRNLDSFIALDAALCGQCDIATFARRFLFSANLPLFRRVWRSGIIYSVNRIPAKWEPALFDVAPQPQSAYYDVLDAAYHAALVYYDHTTGPGDVAERP